MTWILGARFVVNNVDVAVSNSEQIDASHQAQILIRQCDLRMCPRADGMAAKRGRFMLGATLAGHGSVIRFHQKPGAAQVFLHLTPRVCDTVTKLARQSAAPLGVNARISLDEVEVRSHLLLNERCNAAERL
jgi:hypothetical protein